MWILSSSSARGRPRAAAPGRPGPRSAGRRRTPPALPDSDDDVVERFVGHGLPVDGGVTRATNLRPARSRHNHCHGHPRRRLPRRPRRPACDDPTGASDDAEVPIGRRPSRVRPRQRRHSACGSPTRRGSRTFVRPCDAPMMTWSSVNQGPMTAQPVERYRHRARLVRVRGRHEHPAGLVQTVVSAARSRRPMPVPRARLVDPDAHQLEVTAEPVRGDLGRQHQSRRCRSTTGRVRRCSRSRTRRAARPCGRARARNPAARSAGPTPARATCRGRRSPRRRCGRAASSSSRTTVSATCSTTTTSSSDIRRPASPRRPRRHPAR